MNFSFKHLIIVVLISISTLSYGQSKDEKAIEHQTLFGLSISPVLPGNFVRNNDIKYTSDSVSYNINLQNSLSYGAEIRHYFTYRFAIVTGIYFTKRHLETSYKSHYENPTYKQADTSFTRDLTFYAYEIPIHAFGYVRLTESMYMSIAGGFNLNFYPSHIKTDNIYMERVGTKIGKKAWQFFQLGYTANLGWEYRTNNSGTFYLGASYQVRTDKMARIGFYEKQTIDKPNYENSISGDYFSINLKYFFSFNKKKSTKDLFR